MANSNAPMGLMPVDTNGNNWTGQGRLVCFPASYASNVFLGDPLVPTGATDNYGVPIVTLATAGATNTILGSFNGLTNGPAGGGASAQAPVLRDYPPYRQASVLQYGLCCDDPNQLYIVQEDSDGGAIAVANAGYTNGNLIAGAGSTATGFSGWMLDSSTVDGNANATYQVRILGLARGPDNVVGTYAKWIVRINLPALWAAAGY
jgi:hypothetical protein